MSCEEENLKEAILLADLFADIKPEQLVVSANYLFQIPRKKEEKEWTTNIFLS